MKKCSMSLIIKEMPIKTTMRQCLSPVRRTIEKTKSAGEDWRRDILLRY
jgi:hypothetical protein